jgi:hypothetical protein
MRTSTTLSIVILVFAANAFSQTDTLSTERKGSFDLMISNTGLSFGNGQDMDGIRFAWRDGDFEEVNGINFSMWQPYENPSGVVHGVSFGIVAPSARELDGLSFGLGGVIANESMNGINLGGLGLVTQGEANGINVAGLGVVAQGDIAGFTFGGLGVVSQGSLSGISIAGLGLVTQKGLLGVNIGGLGTVAQGSVLGLNIGGLGVVAQGEVTGMTVGGLGVVSQAGIVGVNVAGLGLVGQGEITGVSVAGAGVITRDAVTGLSLTLGLVSAEGAITGVTFAGYKMKSRAITGLNVGIGWTESTQLTGFTCAAYNRTYGLQQGLVIGVFNHTEDLLGVQIGLINCVESNPPWLKVLPLVNARF